LAKERAASYSYPQQYTPGEDIYIPTEVYPASRGQVSMIHKTSFSKREAKKFSREIKFAEVAMAAVLDYIDWSDQSILFSRADHPTVVPRLGHAALVLEAQIGGYNMSKVFMDGGSGLNLLFARTMKAMELSVDMLKESDTGSMASSQPNPLILLVKFHWMSSSAHLSISERRSSSSR
jgi:hypothetical protein